MVSGGFRCADPSAAETPCRCCRGGSSWRFEGPAARVPAYDVARYMGKGIQVSDTEGWPGLTSRRGCVSSARHAGGAAVPRRTQTTRITTARVPVPNPRHPKGVARAGSESDAPEARREAVRGKDMGGTGLEPVTPSLSIRRNRSSPFGAVRQMAWLFASVPQRRTPNRTRANAPRDHRDHRVREITSRTCAWISRRSPSEARRGRPCDGARAPLVSHHEP